MTSEAGPGSPDPVPPPADPALPSGDPASSLPSTAPDPARTDGWTTADQGGPIAVPGAGGHVFAGMLGRSAAWLADGLVLALASGVISSAADTVFGLEEGSDRSWTLMAILSLFVGGVYFVGSWTSRLRGTPMQRLLGMQVGSAFEGQTLGLWEALVRWGVLWSVMSLTWLPGDAGTIGWTIWVLWSIVLFVSTLVSSTRQGLHDRIARSAVVAYGPQRASLAVAVIALSLVAYGVATVVTIALDPSVLESL